MMNTHTSNKASQRSRTPSRREYIELLVDAALQDADEMKLGILEWSALHRDVWLEQGRDETWIRLRIESATRWASLIKDLQAERLTPGQIRKAIRQGYEQMAQIEPDLYRLMLQRTGQTEPDPTIRGTIYNLPQRYALRVLVFHTNEQSYRAFCQWKQLEPSGYEEGRSERIVYDLSTVEELDYQLSMAQFMITCFEERPRLSNQEISQRISTWGKQARHQFIVTYGYAPEQSTTPFIPVTLDGPQDHDDYMAWVRSLPDDDDKQEL
jgi:hypothetical protein